MCPGMMGTPGYTAFEGMSSEPVKGAAGHDVVAIAMVLLRVCLKKEWRSPNLLTHPVRRVNCKAPRFLRVHAACCLSCTVV